MIGVSLKAINYGDFERNEIYDCLLFYIGFSSGSLLQPYLVSHRIGKDSTTAINSIYNLRKNQYSPIPLPPSVGSQQYRDSKYHYQLFTNIFQTYSTKPNYFKSINSQWSRVWHSFQSTEDIMTLTLSTSIEGLLNDIFIPELKSQDDNEERQLEIKEIKKSLSTLEIKNEDIVIIMNSLAHSIKLTASKALNEFVEKKVISRDEKKQWTKLRNASAHPKISHKSASDALAEDSMIRSCINIFHLIIFNALNYSGPIYDLSSSNEVRVITHTDLLLEIETVS